MNIRKTQISQTSQAPKPAPPKQGEEQQKPQPPLGDAFAKNTSNAMTEYGVYSIGATGGLLGLKAGGFAGVTAGGMLGAIFSSSGGGIVMAATIGGMVGGVAGLAGGAYAGIRLGGKALDFAGNVGEKAFSASPNVGKAAAQAVTLGALSSITHGPMSGLGVVGITAAVGAYDTFVADKK